MKKTYFTLTGCNHYYGTDFMKKGMKLKLKKEPDNKYDKEAIQVKVKGLGVVGYVAMNKNLYPPFEMGAEAKP